MNTPITDAAVGKPGVMHKDEHKELTLSRQIAYARMISRQLERDRARLINSLDELRAAVGLAAFKYAGQMAVVQEVIDSSGKVLASLEIKDDK